MKLRTLMLTFALALLAPQSFATTYYFSLGGSDATQCTGLSPVSYPGTGTAQACAWSNLQYALPPGTSGDGVHAIRIAAGDTLQIAPGTYPMGYGTPGAEACQSGATYNCILDTSHGRRIPNGVTITGMQSGSCTSKPVLWGTGGQYDLIDITGTSNVTLSCLELTDHATCVDLGGYTGGVVPVCAGSVGDANGASQGIEALGGMSNLTLSYLDVHGLGGDGIHIGNVNGITADHIRVYANAHAGWNGDVGEATGQSSNSGTILIKNSEVSWNGCSESYPAGTILTCIGSQHGGYGDGLGTYQTGGNWRVINSKFLHNASDGLDLLYADGTGSVFVDRVTSEFNASQQVKAAGPSTIQNSVINGDCSEFTGLGLVGSSGELCRASGNAIEVDPVVGNDTITIQNNTITGDGDCLIVEDSPPITPGPSVHINIISNILLGQVSYLQKNGGAYTCAFFADKGTPTITYTSNLMWHYRNQTCGAGLTCVDPGIKNETGASFDATPLAGSPALGGTTTCTSLDWGSQTRGNPCTIGAIETTTTPQQPNYTGN